MLWATCIGWAVVYFATYDAPAAFATSAMLNGMSVEPYGAVVAKLPSGLVGLICPPVIP